MRTPEEVAREMTCPDCGEEIVDYASHHAAILEEMRLILRSANERVDEPAVHQSLSSAPPEQPPPASEKT